MSLFATLLLFIYNLLFPAPQPVKSHTFAVDDVKQNSIALPTAKFTTIVQNKLDKLIFAVPEEHTKKKIAPTRLNGFVETIHVAYDEHRPLLLSPDDVWLTICQAFGNHIAVTADEQKDDLVANDAPKTISVFIYDLAQDNQKGWEQLVDGFNDSLTEFLQKDAVSLVNQKFSTTTPVITTAYQITLMDAVKSYFSYEGGSGCGIPEITLLGSTKDWQKIYDELDQFNDYGMEFWTKELKPVIQEFINASEGNPNVAFWQEIYKHESFYGITSVTGWVHKFFPYLRADQNTEPGVWDRETEFKKTYYRNPYIEGKKHLLSEVSTFDFPKGYVSVPFTWVEERPKFGDTVFHKLELNAGFLGMEQSKDLALEPFISWCITHAEGERPEHIRWDWQAETDSTIMSIPFYWWPGTKNVADQLPIYDPSRNKEYESSVAALKEDLKNAGFSSGGASTLELVACMDGSTILMNVKGPLEKKEAALKNFFAVLEKKWQPARFSAVRFDADVDSVVGNFAFELQL